MDNSSQIFQKGKQYSDYVYELILNEKTIDEKSGYMRCFGQGIHKDFFIFSRELYEQISNYPINSIIRPDRDAMWMRFNWNLNDDFDFFYLYDFDFGPKEDTGLKYNYIGFRFHLDIFNWNNSWSPKEHIEEFIVSINNNKLSNKYDLEFEKPESDFEADDKRPGQTWFVVRILDYPYYDLPISHIVNECIQVFTEVNNQILERYQFSLTIYSLTRHFNFPSEVKTACEQYLLYFAEFLSDVGIEVTTSITEENENVILAIEPRNKEEALENISQLLKLYLQLPTSPVVASYQPTLELSFPAQKLQAQVLQLQSQLTLANAERQYLNSTIHQKDTLIAQQAQTIQSQQFTAQILLDSLQRKEDDEEELVGQIIRVKDYEAGPLAIGLPELLRKLKALFGS